MKSLNQYKKRRKFSVTPEPKPKKVRPSKEPIFVIQEHHARSLHFDLRLEMNGVLKSWAIPNGPSKKIGDKRLAILTEDHPIGYADFEGTIPEGEYGAGEVLIWDRGIFKNVKAESIDECFENGIIECNFYGRKMKGTYALVHFRSKNWLLIKVKTKK